MPFKDNLTENPNSLQRFVDAQAPVYSDALDELRAGNKASHWMWFIFPQLKDLGRSSIARFYGITGMAEATQYLAHPILGARLHECTQAMLDHQHKTAHEILHSPDDLKFCSCMTLFSLASPQEPLFTAALQQFYRGVRDEMTVQLLNRMAR